MKNLYHKIDWKNGTVTHVVELFGFTFIKGWYGTPPRKSVHLESMRSLLGNLISSKMTIKFGNGLEETISFYPSKDKTPISFRWNSEHIALYLGKFHDTDFGGFEQYVGILGNHIRL